MQSNLANPGVFPSLHQGCPLLPSNSAPSLLDLSSTFYLKFRIGIGGEFQVEVTGYEVTRAPRFKRRFLLCADVFHIWTSCSEATSRWDVNWAGDVASENYPFSNKLGLGIGKGRN